MLLSWNWWRECVLLIPIARIPQASVSMFAQFAPTGEAMFMSPIPSRDLNRPSTYRGPVEFRSLQTGQKTGEQFTSEDFIECLANQPRLLTVIRRQDRRWVADLASGQLLHPLPDAPADRRLCYAAGPGRIVYRVGNELVCFDYLKQETVWTLAGLTVLRDVGDRYAVVMRPLKNSINPNVADLAFPFVIDLTDGQLVPGVERFHRCDFHELSPDGRLLMVSDRKRLRVLDIERNWVVWQTDPRVCPPPLKMSFSEDSSELVQAGLNSQGRFQIGRVRISDGRILAPLPQPAGVKSRGDFPGVSFTADRRFAFTDRRSRFEVYWHELRVKAARMLKSIGWSYSVLPFSTQKVLIDVKAETIVGPISNLGWTAEGAQPSPTSDGFLVRDHEFLKPTKGRGSYAVRAGDWKIYRLPPGRNWLVLAELWLAPVILWGAACVIARFWRRRRAPAAG
jgi:hypothetical protein